MAMEDLWNGLNAFTQGVQELNTSRAIGEATQQVKAMNTQVMSEQQKEAERMRLGNELAMHLQQLGAPQQRIEGAVGAVKPEQFANPLDMFMKAKLRGNEEQAKTAMGLQQEMYVKPAAAVEEQKFRHQMALQEAASKNKYEIALMKAQGKGGTTLTKDSVDKVTAMDTGIASIQTMRDMVQADGSLVGPIDANKPFRKQFSSTADFDMMYNQFRNEYVHQMTGAGVSEKEADRLFTALVSPDQNAKTFLKGLDRLEQWTNQKKDIHLQAFEKAGYDTSGFKKPVATTSQSPQQAGGQPQIFTKIKSDGSYEQRVMVPGGSIPLSTWQSMQKGK